MWLVDDELTVEDVIERYNKNKDKYKDYEKYLKKYPNLVKEDIYVLNKISKKKKEDLKNTIIKL